MSRLLLFHAGILLSVGCSPPPCEGFGSFVSVTPSDDVDDELTLVESRVDGFVLEGLDGELRVDYPDVGAAIAVEPGTSLSVRHVSGEAAWISVRDSAGGLVFEGGLQPDRCEGGFTELQFCIVQTTEDSREGLVCSVESGGGFIGAEIQFKSDDGLIGLEPGESRTITIDGRRFHAEVFFAGFLSPPGIGLTFWSQALWIALD